MNLKKNISTLVVPHHKNTAGMAAVSVAPPNEVLLPMNMHSGQAAVPTVVVGEHVFLGQLIAREEGRNSVPVHASVSGVVKAIEPYGSSLAVRIESDGKMERDPELKAPDATDLGSFLNAVRQSGIVGLGGAAFPLWAKLDAARKGHIRTVLINGAECEPYITSDNRTMVEHSDLVKAGVELLKKYLGSEEFIIGIEKNKPDAIEEMEQVFKDDTAVTVKPLKSVYPQGAKQVLLYNATGKVVGEGQRLASLGVIIINVTSLAKMAQFMTDGTPLISRCVTVDGSAVKEPKNLIVPIGTPISYLIEKAGGLKCEAGKIIVGGPMMGKCAATVDQPIIKATNAVLVMSRADCAGVEPTACIHCGRCVANCPLSLNPTRFAKAMELDDEEKRLSMLEGDKVLLCMECGCCSYVCPAHRPLVDTNRAAKRFVKSAQAAKKEGGK